MSRQDNSLLVPRIVCRWTSEPNARLIVKRAQKMLEPVWSNLRATLEQNYYVGVVVSCEPIEARRGAGGLIAAELDQVGEAAKRFSDTPIRAVQK
jgi:hypothetical protein